ncbi:EARP-interacting protein homolog isoform X3 [Artemia franciscana]|uniref:EARP-interacting protein homolog isoform X3 n=1 Tax=Artemia franciscana TaxID=6661 RepID=UPI0032D9B472
MAYEDESSVIYGLDAQARAITSQANDTEKVQFFVGTLSLKALNHIYVLDYDEDSNTVGKKVYSFKNGEVWGLKSLHFDQELLAVIFNSVEDSSNSLKAGVFRIPNSEFPSIPIAENSGCVETVSLFDTHKIGKNVRSLEWHPTNGSEAVMAVDANLIIWSMATSSPTIKTQLNVDSSPDCQINVCRWNPHHQCSQVATAFQSSIQSWDIRSMKEIWHIEDAHRKSVRALDFNPNKQYCLASGGNDGNIKYWDTRNVRKPVLVQAAHSHWIWDIAYNCYHDQLMLSSGSDSKVVLSSSLSVSSEMKNPSDSEGETDQTERSLLVQDSPNPKKFKLLPFPHCDVYDRCIGDRKQHQLVFASSAASSVQIRPK